MTQRIVNIKGEPKYALDTETGQLVNKATGNPIPEDEPIIVFRAQDALLPDILATYIANAQDRNHKFAASLRLAEVLEWQNANPLRVKQPDTLIDGNWPQLHRA